MAFIQRAQRFHVPMRMMWKPLGARDWIDAIGLNASRTGVLFQSNRLAVAGTEVELQLALAWETAPWVDVADISCVGRIVRTELGHSNREQILLASTIDRYLLLPEFPRRM
jgi:hypothetical protein